MGNEGGRFPTHCARFRGRRRRFPYGRCRLPCRRQNFRYIGFAKGWLRQLNSHAAATGGICRGVAGSFLAHPWGMGKDGEYSHCSCKSERGCVDRRSAYSLDESSGKELPKFNHPNQEEASVKTVKLLRDTARMDTLT